MGDMGYTACSKGVGSERWTGRGERSLRGERTSLELFLGSVSRTPLIFLTTSVLEHFKNYVGHSCNLIPNKCCEKFRYALRDGFAGVQQIKAQKHAGGPTSSRLVSGVYLKQNTSALHLWLLWEKNGLSFPSSCQQLIAARLAADLFSDVDFLLLLKSVVFITVWAFRCTFFLSFHA